MNYVWPNDHLCRLLGVVSFVRSDYNTCLRTGQVVSDVFCLPSNYRKDVPPKSKKGLNVNLTLSLFEFTFKMLFSNVNVHIKVIIYPFFVLFLLQPFF